MSWIEGALKPYKKSDINERLAEIQNFEDDKDARLYLCEFLRENIYFATKLIFGEELFEFQEIMIKSMMKRDYFLGILSRGMSKTWTAGIFCALYAIMNPGVSIGVLGPVFRQSREILRQIETFSNKPKAVFLRRCFDGTMRKGNDAYEIRFLNGSRIIALPLSDGMKIRGQRFQVVLCDELLGFSERVVNEIIRPFLSTNADVQIRHQIEKMETELIRRGEMKEEDRTQFPNPKLIGLSSASYKFEYLYKMFEDYETQIQKGSDEASYGIMQLSYYAAPSSYFNASFLEEARSSMSDAQFARELGAQFTDDSSGYFSVKKLNDVSIPIGGTPTIEIAGEFGAKYILSIDPSYAESESSDNFAMCVVKIDEENKQGVVVHQYAVAGGSLRDHYFYLYYLLTHFNIVYVIIDSTGGGSQFLSGANESALFKDNKMSLERFEASLDNLDDVEKLLSAKRTYNPKKNVMVHFQHFQSEWIARSNNELQASIDRKRIWFAAPVLDDHYKSMTKQDIPIKNLRFLTGKDDEGHEDYDLKNKKIDLIEKQADLIRAVKDECALIQVSSSRTGILSFDLPGNLRRETGPKKARKDSYSALLLANWALRCYFAISSTEEKKQEETFAPFFI